jgi:hypothetical protein
VNHPRPPKAPFDAIAGARITASIIVLPDGSVDSTTLKVTGTGDGQYAIKMLEWLSKEAKWTAGTVAGCAVVSHAGLITVRVGITRTR